MTETKEGLIWDWRGAEREHGTRSTASLLIFPFNHPASLARVRSALPSASLAPHRLVIMHAQRPQHIEPYTQT